MKLAAKAGAGNIVREMIIQSEQNGNPKVWTALEMERALRFINDRIENFGKADALAIIQTLTRKFDLTVADLHFQDDILNSTHGVQGLQ